jgi:hypothetical protein
MVDGFVVGATCNNLRFYSRISQGAEIKHRSISHLSMLKAWSRDGERGKLFDGISNVRIDGRVAPPILDNKGPVESACLYAELLMSEMTVTVS